MHGDSATAHNLMNEWSKKLTEGDELSALRINIVTYLVQDVCSKVFEADGRYVPEEVSGKLKNNDFQLFGGFGGVDLVE